MGAVAALAGLEQAVTDARAAAPGGPAELDALVAYASRLVSDPIRRGEVAREGLLLADQLGAEAAGLRCRAMIAEAVRRHHPPAEALPEALAPPPRRTGSPTRRRAPR